MALRITLKPNERIVIGRMVLTNGPRDSEFTLKGEHVPVLRESQIMRLEEEDTPCRRLYLTVQSIYVEDIPLEEGLVAFQEQVRDIVEAAPSLSELLLAVSEPLIDGNFYKALRACKRLLAREEELFAAFRAKQAEAAA